MTNLYLLLSGLQVAEANSSSGYYSEGLPALTALAGMVHALQRSVNQALSLQVLPADDVFSFASEATPQKVRFADFTPFFTAYSDSDVKAKRSSYQERTQSKVLDSQAIQHAPIIDFEMGFVVTVSLPDELVGLFQAVMLSERGKSLVLERRVAGGSITGADQPQVFSDFDAALNKVPYRAYLFENVDKELEQETLETSKSILDLMVEKTSRPRNVTTIPKDDAQAKQVAEQMLTQRAAPTRRYAAIGVGFRRIAKATVGGQPRDFVEPLTGLVRIRRIEAVRKDLQQSKTCLVRWEQFKPTPDGYYLVGASTL